MHYQSFTHWILFVQQINPYTHFVTKHPRIFTYVEILSSWSHFFLLDQSLLIHMSHSSLRPNNSPCNMSLLSFQFLALSSIWDVVILIHSFPMRPIPNFIKLISSLIVLSFNHQNPRGGLDALSAAPLPAVGAGSSRWPRRWPPPARPLCTRTHCPPPPRPPRARRRPIHRLSDSLRCHSYWSSTAQIGCALSMQSPRGADSPDAQDGRHSMELERTGPVVFCGELVPNIERVFPKRNRSAPTLVKQTRHWTAPSRAVPEPNTT